jgi:hypothetical protein
MPNAWDRVGTPHGRWTASRVLVITGSVLLVLATLAVVLYRTFLDSSTFADGIDQIRQTDVVSDALGVELAEQIVQADPDLVAVRPLIEQVGAFVAGSDVLSPLVRRAAAEAQQAATSADGTAIVLRVADAGVVAASALAAFAPDLAAQVPDDLSVTLASVGSQEVFARSLLFSRWLSVAAWVLPFLALGCLALGVWVAPNQRRALVRAGLGTLAAGAGTGVLTLAVGIAVATLDETTLAGALADGAWQVWGRSFWVAAGILVVGGALVGAAASALLPEIDVDQVLAEVRHRITARPASTEGVALRGLLVALVGIGLVVAPLRLLSWGAVLVGLAVLAYGVSEITAAAVSSRSGEPEPAEVDAVRDPDEPVTVGWRLGALAAAVLAVLGMGAVWLVRDVSTDPAEAVAMTVGDGAVCNGHAELCPRPYPEVAYLTTHNAMSAADEPGWFLAEQPHGVIDQLGGGARGLMIDVWEARPAGEYVSSLTVNLSEGRAQLEESFGPAAVDSAERLVAQVVGEPTGPADLFLCHGLCEIGATPLAPTLSALRTWLDANPNEVVTVIVENHVPAEAIAAAFVAAGLEPYLHTPSATSWPTLQEMITSGRRLVVMTEEGDGGTQFPWLANAFALTQETPYTFPSVDDFSCEPNRGPADAPLFLVNHWLSGFTALVTAARQVNVTDVLGTRVEQCRDERGLFPTFVGVNYYDIGDAAEVVDDLNGVG